VVTAAKTNPTVMALQIAETRVRKLGRIEPPHQPPVIEWHRRGGVQDRANVDDAILRRQACDC
jgi:hypothetical protein